MYTTSLRFRKWRHHVLDSLQRTDLPVFVKGHVTAAARSSRSMFYYGAFFPFPFRVGGVHVHAASLPPSSTSPPDAFLPNLCSTLLTD